MRLFALALLVVVELVPAPPAAAQEGPTLDQIEELAKDGRSEEARVHLIQWWEATLPEASRRDRQRALWLRGTLTVDPAHASLDFRRLVVEYPGGPYSDDALLRLAQVAHASGDGAVASAYVDALVRDHPGTPVTTEAVRWRDTAGPPPEAAQEVEVQPPPPAEDVPARRQAEVVTQGPRFSVQLGAFSEVERARSLYRRALDEGFEARLVRVTDARLLRVRVGLFDSAASAGELLSQLRAMGFIAALVRDAHTEERIRR